MCTKIKSYAIICHIKKNEGGIAMFAPNQCPMCYETTKWKKVDESKKGFSVGKAVGGAVLFGPIGLVGGALGKKKEYYCCGNCGFEHDYDTR